MNILGIKLMRSKLLHKTRPKQFLNKTCAQRMFSGWHLLQTLLHSVQVSIFWFVTFLTKLFVIPFNNILTVTLRITLQSPRLLNWWKLAILNLFKDSPDPSHLIFEINVGKRRIRHITTLNLNYLIFGRFWVDVEIQFQSRSMSDPTFSDIDFKNN